MLTKQEIAAVLPPHLKGNATQALADRINNITTDPAVAEQTRENFINYARVLQMGRFKTEDYINAVHYVSYKMMEKTNEEAYALTHPERYQALIERGASSKDISAYVAAYHKNKLVNLVMEQVLTPNWVLNQGLQQQAINRLGHLMMNAKSEKVQADSAIALMTQLKKPEKTGIELDISVKESSGMTELKNMLAQVAEMQIERIGQGVAAREIAALPLIEGEYTEVDDEEAGEADS